MILGPRLVLVACFTNQSEDKPLMPGEQFPKCAVSSLSQLQSFSSPSPSVLLILLPTSLLTVLTPLDSPPSTSFPTTNASPLIRHCVPVSLIHHTASTGPPPPLPCTWSSLSACPALDAKICPTFCIRTSVVKVGMSESKIGGLRGASLCLFSGREPHIPR